jgi:hypothetical protein
MTDDSAEQAIMELVSLAGPVKSISSEDAARRLAGDAWRTKNTLIKLAAIRLAKDEKIEILRKGRRVAPEDARGVIRLRIMNGTSKNEGG